MADTALELADALRGRYTLGRLLGRGGMATVFLAHDLKHDRPVALNVLDAEVAATVGPERFLREIQVTARLDHPNILPVFDSGEDRGRLWYTMPYVQGETLRGRLRSEGTLPLEDALRFAREVADALECAHRSGIVHRDVKPENILLRRRSGTSGAAAYTPGSSSPRCSIQCATRRSSARPSLDCRSGVRRSSASRAGADPLDRTKSHQHSVTESA